MKPGVIKRILDYYLAPEGQKKFKEEISRAITEFFDGYPVNGIDPESSGHLEEWFLYDFKLKNGKTPLADFYDANPLNLSEADRAIYKDLQTNEYDFFEVVSVNRNKSLKLKNVRSGRIYDVREKAATQEINQKDIFLIRVIKVDDHYELAGGSSLHFPSFGEGARSFLAETKDILTPKVVYHILAARSQDKEPDTINGENLLVTGSLNSRPIPEGGYDDCAICRLIKKAKAEGREPTKAELKEAFAEAEREKLRC